MWASVDTQWDTLHHGKISCVARARAASTMVIASNSTSRRHPRARERAAFLYHSPIQPFQKQAARGSLLKNPCSQKGLIKKNYWELSFWQKHEKGVTSALLFLLFQTRGAKRPGLFYIYICVVWRALRARTTPQYNYHAYTELIRMGKGKGLLCACDGIRTSFSFVLPTPQTATPAARVTLIYQQQNNSGIWYLRVYS